jgi:hypothetical protein
LRFAHQRAGKKSRLIVTRFAVARKCDISLGDQIVDIFLIEGFAEGISVRRLQTLRVNVGMTFGTARRRDKMFAGNKFAVKCRRIRRGERLVFAETKIIRLGNPIVILVRRKFFMLTS